MAQKRIINIVAPPPKQWVPKDKVTRPGRNGGRLSTAGRPKGAVNKTTREVKEVIAETFERIGGIETFATWARSNKDEFYKLYSKLLPVQLQGAASNGAINIILTKEESEL